MGNKPTISAFDTLVNELCDIARAMQERNDFSKSFAASQEHGATHLGKLKAFAKSLTSSLSQAKRVAAKAKQDAAKAKRERAVALLEKARVALASGNLSPYHQDLLKQRIHQLESTMKGKK